jgi:hypothetical protein
LASDGDRYQTVVTRDAPPYGVTDDVKKPRLLFVSICGSSEQSTYRDHDTRWTRDG